MSKIFADGILGGHVAFVTGGGTGITGGVARALAEAGANVALVSRSMEHLEPAAKAINHACAFRGSSPTVREGSHGSTTLGEAFAVAADVRNPEQVAQAIAATIDRFGKIDIVVNGAAGNFLCKPEELSPNGFGTVVDIDLKGTFNVCRAAFDQLKEHRGQILNISATLHYLGTPMQLHVSAAKAGVIGLTIAWLLGGVVIVESVFNYPGLGRLAVDAVKDRDVHAFYYPPTNPEIQSLDHQRTTAHDERPPLLVITHGGRLSVKLNVVPLSDPVNMPEPNESE